MNASSCRSAATTTWPISPCPTVSSGPDRRPSVSGATTRSRVSRVGRPTLPGRATGLSSTEKLKTSVDPYQLTKTSGSTTARIRAPSSGVSRPPPVISLRSGASRSAAPSCWTSRHSRVGMRHAVLTPYRSTCASTSAASNAGTGR